MVSRKQLYLLKGLYEDGQLTNETEPKTLNTVDTKPEYLERVKEGFKAVLGIWNWSRLYRFVL